MLIVVAFRQIIEAKTASLTPWKGAGFGMFSTVDSGERRLLHVTARVGPYSLRLTPPAFGNLRTIARNLPTEENLQEYARTLASQVWVEDPSSMNAPDPDTSTVQDEPFETPSRIGRGDLVQIGIPRLRPYKGGRIPGRIWCFDTLKVVLHRPKFSAATGQFTLVALRTVVVKGLSREDVAQRLGVPVSLLAFGE